MRGSVEGLLDKEESIQLTAVSAGSHLFQPVNHTKSCIHISLT